MSEYEYGIWSAVIVNVILFTLFVLGFSRPKKKRDWRSAGVYEGFIIALFTEMYGFPLTIFILTSYFGKELSFDHAHGHLLGVFFGLEGGWLMVICQIGTFMMFGGIFIMALGWRKIHKAENYLVTSGLYSRMRHPQYFGIFMIITGMIIQWPTIITVIMFPVLVLMYYRLAKKEEVEMESKFGQYYLQYKRAVRMFIPMKKS